MDAMHPEYLHRLAEFVCRTRLADLPDAALLRARRVLADCIPVVAAGMQVPEMRDWAARHLARAGSGDCWVIGTGRRAAPRDAALVNGTAGTWLELDEGNLISKGHPGIQVVPAALAVAQDVGASGEELLLAHALGYEVCARVSYASDVHLTIHPHGTWGVIGAAVAAARLKRASPGHVAELLSVAAGMAMATSRNTLLEGSTVRNIYTGHSGYMGIVASELVEAGFTGERDGIAITFGRILSGSWNPAQAVAGLGREWLIARGYYKLHPTGRYVHAAIDALEDLIARAGERPDPAAIEAIEVRAYALAAMLNGKQITTSFGARFSIPFALASILVHGRSGLASFDDAAVANPAVQALVAKVDVVEDPAHTAAYPGTQRCDVAIRLVDGRVLAGHCEVMKGEPERPHTEAELEGKFKELGAPIWGGARTEALYRGMMEVERIPDFRAFAAGFDL